jgi:hypothetical protein
MLFCDACAVKCPAVKTLLAACFIAAAAQVRPAAAEWLWFPVGEELHYRLKWGIFSIGSSRVETAEVETGGRKLIAVRYYVKTNVVFDKIYPVNDFIEVLIDPDGFVPVTFTRKSERRGPVCNETIVFDRAERKAEWSSMCMNTNMTIAIEKDTRDIISLLYYMRQFPLSEDTSITNQVIVTKSITEMVVKVGRKTKMDAAERDNVECFEITPVAKLDDLLVEEGEVKAWVSADERRILTRLEIGAGFGTVKTLLEKVVGGEDEWVKREDEE